LLHKCKEGLSCDSLQSWLSRLKCVAHMRTILHSQAVLSKVEYIWESSFVAGAAYVTCLPVSYFPQQRWLMSQFRCYCVHMLRWTWYLPEGPHLLHTCAGRSYSINYWCWSLSFCQQAICRKFIIVVAHDSSVKQMLPVAPCTRKSGKSLTDR